jgi:hypothetical protein
MKALLKRNAVLASDEQHGQRPQNPSVDSDSTSLLSFASCNTSYIPEESKSTIMTNSRMRRPFTSSTFAINLLVVLILFQVASLYFLFHGRQVEHYKRWLKQAAVALHILRHDHLEFQQTFNGDDMERCYPIQNEHNVSFSLAISLVEKDLEKVPHHCKRWGIQAPISIAVWTDFSPEQVRDKIISFPSTSCHPNQMTITTLSPTMDGSNSRNRLRNLAIQGAATTHVLPLDVHMWTSVDLYETLHAPNIVHALANDPQLTILVPAFEVNMESCKKQDIQGCSAAVPRDFDELIVQLAEKAVAPMSPSDDELQGSTDYGAWARQSRSSLVKIDCISSADRYQPFLVVQRCQGLPPFQESLSMQEQAQSGNVHATDSTWILHLIRLGYTIQQLGGEFVVYLQGRWTGRQDVFASTIQIRMNENHPSELSRSELRRRSKTRNEFFSWLDHETPGQRVVLKCKEVDVA